MIIDGMKNLITLAYSTQCRLLENIFISNVSASICLPLEEKVMNFSKFCLYSPLKTSFTKKLGRLESSIIFKIPGFSKCCINQPLLHQTFINNASTRMYFAAKGGRGRGL